jgi:hypothetical protein
VLADSGKKIGELDEIGIRDYIKNELPIRFGSAIYSKMQKRSWNPFAIPKQTVRYCN